MDDEDFAVFGEQIQENAHVWRIANNSASMLRLCGCLHDDRDDYPRRQTIMRVIIIITATEKGPLDDDII